jgi:hypothetical protein
MHSSHRLREGARPEVVWDNMGHANIDVTQNVYGKSRHAEAWGVALAPAPERRIWLPKFAPEPAEQIARSPE